MRPTTLIPVLLALSLPALAAADARTEARYPYDPACPWGRIANGKGMLLRCLTQSEAASLAGKNPAEVPAKGSLPAEKPVEKPAEQTPKYALSVGPISAAKGEITIGALSKPLDRYRACVDDNGGLTKTRAKVVVEFLVRGERSRAEGAEARSHIGVRHAVAKCIADVVDRRRVGTPSVAMTEATLTIEMRQTQ